MSWQLRQASIQTNNEMCSRIRKLHNRWCAIFYTPVVMDPVIAPPFPEYTSGHSVQSAAAAVVLSDLFGHDYVFTDHTHARLGYAPRAYASFMDAANEAAVSRLYGGIHFRAAIENGIEQGRCVGERVLKLRFDKS